MQLKPLNLLMVVLVGCTSYITLVFLVKYIPYHLHMRKVVAASSQNDEAIIYYTTQDTNGEMKITQNNSIRNVRIQYLNQLTTVPILGNLFVEEKVTELALMGLWENVTLQANTAIHTIVNQNSFEIWYNKALAECMMGNLTQCEISIAQTSYLSDDLMQPYVASLYQFMDKASEISKKKRSLEKKDQQLHSKQEIRQSPEIIDLELI